MILFSKLSEITGGKIFFLNEDQPITSLLIDTRKGQALSGSLFFAIKGERHDGHQYLAKAYEQGIRQFVVELPPKEVVLSQDCNVLHVDNTITALQKIASFHRHEFSIPIIGITGSNGKTIVKEWLSQALSKQKVVAKNPGSYNSQVGVPLSVWQLQPFHQLGIFEAGISKPGEMEHLHSIIDPTIGIFTNIGPAHDEGFKSMEEKVREKLKLFVDSEVLIYCKDHELIDNLVDADQKTFTWGYDRSANLVIEKQDQVYILSFRNERHSIRLPFSDRASTENCFHCVATMIYLGISFTEIQEYVLAFRSIAMRLELKEGINQCQIIDDTYNNDLAGLEISLQFLTSQQQKKKKTLILSDVLESGLEGNALIKEIKSLLKKYPVQRFIGIGPLLNEHVDEFQPSSAFYQTTDEFLQKFDRDQFQQEIILVKGARKYQFERIVQKLQRKVHGTIMEIDLNAVVSNLNYFKAKVGVDTRIMVMVKAFAYGSGSNEIASLLQYHQVDYLGVAYADEGVELRKNNITLPIMVMNPSEDSFDQLLQFGLEPEVYSFKIFNSLLQYLNGKPCKVHVKLDTGMHRLGFNSNDVPDLIQLLKQNPHITVASIFSHLAGADEATHDEFSKHQAQVFLREATIISDALRYRPLFHILNSPGILRLPEFKFDMVRLGIGLYGINPTQETNNYLKPVATLKTILSQIMHVKKGESIGYGRRGRAEEDTRIGTIAIGYADGFSRAFSRGVGEVMVNGKRAPVIGNICMDMTMINLTGIEATEGDEVIIFGRDLPIQEVASKINTIPYEILTSTSERVKRVFVAESV
jgi:alanine racemase